MSEPFIGEIRIMPYTYAPRNWAWCQGQTIPIMSNTSLYSILSNKFGGDGRINFRLPNLSGRTPMHPGRGPGLSYYTDAQFGGCENVTLNNTHLPEHNHALQVYNNKAASVNANTGDTKDPTNAVPASAKRARVQFKGYKKNPDMLQPMSPQALQSYGGSQPHTNRQPFLAVNFCIALDGIYPARS